jgi:hypothetical protein
VEARIENRDLTFKCNRTKLLGGMDARAVASWEHHTCFLKNLLLARCSKEAKGLCCSP